MMDNWTTDEFLSHLKQLDADISVQEGQLKINAPKGVMTKALIAELSKRKPDIIERMKSPASDGRSGKALTLKDKLQLPPVKPVSREEPLPLSFAQERLWFLSKLEPDSVAYNMPGSMRFHGHLDIDALKQSFYALSQRHETLRTNFRFVDSRPVQVISPNPTLFFETVDLRHLPEEQRNTEVERLTEKQSRQPFDLETGPLLRVTLYRLDDQDHLMHINMHHIISDYWSFGLICREIGAFYKAETTKESVQIPPLKVQYGDFSHCQREWLQGEVLDAYLDYWKDKLGGELASLDLPTDRPRPAVQTHRGAEYTLSLTEPLIGRLRKMAHREGSSLFMVLLAAFKVLLHRHTGQDDIVVGTPIAGRNRSELENLIGFFINTIVMRTDLSQTPTFKEVFGRVRETALGAYSHKEMPFEKLVEVLSPERDLSRTPIFQVFFNYFRAASNVVKLPGVEAEIGKNIDHEAKFDITLYAMVDGDTLLLRALYNADLFNHERIKMMLDQYHFLLEQVADNPDVSIAEYALLREDQREKLKKKANLVAPVNSFAKFEKKAIESSIVERFEAQVEAHAQRVAVKTPKHEWRYNELNKMANRVANTILARFGNDPMKVALLFEQDAQMVAGVLGALKAGMAYVPLDPSYPIERLGYMLEDCQANVLLTNNLNVDMARGLITDAIDVVNIDDTGELLNKEMNPGIHIDPDSLAYILYTSGSTGRPKGVMQNHRNVLHFTRVYTNAIHISHEDRLTLLSSYSFDAAVMDIYGALLNGAALYPINIREEGLSDLSTWLMDQKITVYHSTPTVYRAFVDTFTRNQKLPFIRIIVLGGEAVFKRDIDAYKRHFEKDCLFVNGLGPTESTMALQKFIDADTELAKDRVPVGYAVADTDIVLLNPEGIADDIQGEIGIQSAHIALGYWNQPDLTKTVFLSDPDGGDRRVYRTGDLGRRLPDGSVEYLGRKDFQVKIRGYRIETAEIENTLIEHPAVKTAAVIARTINGDNRLIAYMVTQNETAVEELNPRQYLRGKLPEYMIPAQFIKLKKFPMTPTRKVDRKALGQMDLEYENEPKPASDQQDDETLSELERTLIAIWKDVLNQEHISIHDNFFELGGHSLLTIQAIERIEEKTGFKINPREFMNQSVGQMAASIEKQLQETPSREDPVPKKGFFSSIKNKLFGEKQYG
jgi:amino acid adenylation domain-containing protein